MLTPVSSVLPDSNLPTEAILQKFDVTTLSGLGCGCRYGMSGLGCDCSELNEDGSCYDPEPCISGAASSTPVVGPPTIPLNPLPVTVTPTSNGQVTVSTPSGTSLTAAQQSQLLQSLISGGVNLAELGLVQPGTTLTAGGITRQNPGATTQGTPLTGGVISSGNSGMLMIGLLAVAGIALIAFSGKGR